MKQLKPLVLVCLLSCVSLGEGSETIDLVQQSEEGDFSGVSNFADGNGRKHESLMLQDEEREASSCPQGCRKEVTELRKNMTDLLIAYNSLCKEIYHLSRHVIFHEHTLRHIALSFHHKQGHSEDDHNHTHHDDHNEGHGDHENEVSRDNVTGSADHHHHHHGHDEAGHGHGGGGHGHGHGSHGEAGHGKGGHAHTGHGILGVLVNKTRHIHHIHRSHGEGDKRHVHHEHHVHESAGEDEHDHSSESGAIRLQRDQRQVIDPDSEVIDTGKFARLVAEEHNHGHDHHDDHHDEHKDNESHKHGEEGHKEENHDHAGHHDDHADDSHGCSPEKRKWSCSLLHEHACHTGHHENTTKPFSEQYDEWFKNLMSHKHGSNITLGSGSHHHGFHHSHADGHQGGEHGADHHNEAEDAHHHHHENHGEMVQPSELVLDQMEESLGDEDMVYATCEMQPNRHISLILQENVRGRVNMWQRRDGNGALQMHMRLKGFRVVSSEQRFRKKRESILMPIEEPFLEGAAQSQPLHSIEHGVHVHVYGNLSRDCQYTGGHYNPTNSAHGGPSDEVRHVGDLGNIRCDEKGEVDAELSFPKVSLSGDYSIIGRSLVVHAQRDDYGRDETSESSTTTGNSGAKIACCIIEKVNRLPPETDSLSSLHPIRGGSRRPVRLERPSNDLQSSGLEREQ